MADRIQLEIVTAEKLILQAQVSEVTIPGKNGYLGVLPGHAPLITELAVGEIAYRPQGDPQSKYISVAWGFAEVLPEKVTVLAEVAERAEEIDVARARRAREQAEAKLKNPQSDVDYQGVQAALDRANARLAVVARSHGEAGNAVS